ncbi:hypothetical protein Mapa_017279 [Marchantia paleacea]|nr:hypothetical protein Mapa_017279 [Marchantia paleacea]
MNSSDSKEEQPSSCTRGWNREPKCVWQWSLQWQNGQPSHKEGRNGASSGGDRGEKGRMEMSFALSEYC